MLRKLLKYEFRATGKIMGPVLCASLFASVLGFFLFFALRDPRLVPALAEKQPALSFAFNTLLGILAFFTYVVGFSTIVVTVFILLRRFYRNFFTDEGYLTFTLPVSTHSLLWAKIVSGFVWTMLGLIADAFCVFSLFLAIAEPEGSVLDWIRDMWLGMKETLLATFGKTDTTWILVEIALTVIVSVLYQLMLYYFAMSLGSMIAKKHKIWAAIGMYFVINTVVGWIDMLSILLLMPSVFLSAGDVSTVTSDMLLVASFVSLAVGMGEYFLTNAILKKKLNLN